MKVKKRERRGHDHPRQCRLSPEFAPIMHVADFMITIGKKKREREME